MNLRLDPILMMVLPKSSFYSLVTEKTCFLGWRTMTFFLFISRTQYWNGNSKFHWHEAPGYFLVHKLGIDLGLDPTLMMILPKSSKFHWHKASGQFHFSIHPFPVSVGYFVLTTHSKTCCCCSTNSTRIEIRNSIGMKPVGNSLGTDGRSNNSFYNNHRNF